MTAPTPQDLESSLSDCMLFEQAQLRRRLRGLRRSALADGSADQVIAKIKADIERSIARRQQRQASLPTPIFPPELPIAQKREEIAAAMSQHQVVVICGETGSGKTTQLPKICLELGRGVGGMIGHTQPRRIAARSVAARIASELQTPLGQVVGYKVRFNDNISPNAFVKIMTDGILLAETQGDRDLLRYDTIIIDEAHERSLNIDFLLGYLKQLLPRRPDLKIIITSATIDPKRFSSHFSDAPIIEVSGRVHPVEVRYRPVQAEEPDEEDPTILEAIIGAVDEICSIGADEELNSDARDILIFLSGEREIRETAHALQNKCTKYNYSEVLSLYARLSTEEQNRVFTPHEGRRIVLATNVAETSLTVPGIRYVIDPGLARISRYSANARVQRLPIERISRASADQRKGRCGRVASGICVRLYSEEDFSDRSEFTDPEILRANLASVILQMKALKLGAIEQFPFIDPPRSASIREGYQTLLELGAVDEQGELTSIGAELAKLPVDPRIGRMVLAARHEGSLTEVLVIAAALATQDPRLRPMDAPKPADLAHQQFADERSDFLSFLKLWEFYHTQAKDLSSNKLRKLCQQQFLSYVRLREWHDVHSQLHSLVTETGMKLNQAPASYEQVHRALLTGLLSNVGFKRDGNEYHGVRDRIFSIFPGSGLFRIGPKWIMAAEVVETTRLFARIAARIQPEWIEQLAAHLIKRTYTAPFWNSRSAHVEAYERLALHGLTIVPKRRVHYGKINPALARELFIQQALVEGDFQPAISSQHGASQFADHNRALVNEVRAIEAKSRRRDVMVDAQVMYDFYDRRIPEGVVNGPLFEKWRRKAERDDPQILLMSRADLMKRHAFEVGVDQFPDSITISGAKLPLEYRLEPGLASDGVTMVIPPEALMQVHEDRAEWLVPGMLREKIIAMIRSLPKSLRVSFVPAPDYADSCMKNLEFGSGSLREQIGARLTRMTGVDVPRDAWNHESLPDHLRMNFAVVDAEGKTLASGRDLTVIKQALSRAAGHGAPSHTLASLKPEFDRQFITTWDFGDLPDRIEITRPPRSIVLYGYPAIIDVGGGESVSLAVLDSEEAARQASRAGVRRLFVLQVRDELAMHIEYLPGIDEMCLHYAPIGSGDELKRDLIDLVADRVFLGDQPEVRTATEFERRARSGWTNLWPAANEVSAVVGRILAAHHTIDLQLAGSENPFWTEAIDDIRFQLSKLLSRDFLLQTPYHWLLHYPRYLQAIGMRLKRLASAGLARDHNAIEEIRGYWQLYESRLQRHRVHNIVDPALQQYRWMIEEMRVSLFAQELRTFIPVSAKRMETQWAQVRG